MARRKIVWADWQLADLSQNYSRESSMVLARRYQVSRMTVERKARELGLHKNHKGYCNLEIERAVREMYADHSLAAIARKVDVHVNTIRNIARRLGLSRSAEDCFMIRSEAVRRTIRTDKAYLAFFGEPKSRRNVSPRENSRLNQLRHQLSRSGYLVVRGVSEVYYSIYLERNFRLEYKAGLLKVPILAWEGPR